MVALFLLFSFTVMAVVYLMLAVIGFRGSVADRFLGFEIPEPVCADRQLLARAHSLVAFWCTGAAALSAAPLLPLYRVIVDPDGGELDLLPLAVLAAYLLVVQVIGGYPFEKIKQLATHAG
ncbi:hypothetical protein JGS22_009920 [Streptomyces sp. P38-E01]|uniref:Uncharacterized protein n=1 Tax=Streptomyces tardus TaxID=2780544 RepID=A0A949JPK6_9ACTN|nr:hypothetical protein [Streptomyces tardus]MBU7597925.1 hypothetical protein [Streptomyces tardus]